MITKSVLEMEFKVKKDYIEIYDSYEYSKNDFDRCLDYILAFSKVKTDVFYMRSRQSLKREWAVHNFLYNIGFATDRTRHVKFETNQTWLLRTSYNIFGFLVNWLID